MVEDLLGKLALEFGLRAPTGVEIFARARRETLGCAGHYQDECNLSLSGGCAHSNDNSLVVVEPVVAATKQREVGGSKLFV